MVCPPLAQPVLDAGGSAPRADRSSPGTFPYCAQKRSTTRGRDAEDATRRQRFGFTPKTLGAAEDALHPLSTSTRQRRRRRQDRSHGCAAPTGTAAIRGHTACRNTEMTQERSAWAQYGQHPALSTPQTPPAHICVELSRLPPVSTIPLCGKGSASPDSHPPTVPKPSLAPGKPVPARGDGTCVHKTWTTEGEGLHRNTSAAPNQRYAQSSIGTRGAPRRPSRWEERSGRSEPCAAALCPAGRAPPPSPPAGLCLPSLLQPKTGTN